MRLESKIRLDRTLGLFLCFLLRPLVYALGQILRRDHSVTADNVRCIVVAKYFGLGSIVHAMPMLRALKTKFPDAKLVFVSREASRPIIPLILDIDEAVFVDDSGLIRLALSNVRLFLNLYRLKVDLFFDLEVFSAYGALVSLFSLARNRYGFFCSKNTDFKTWIYTHLLFFNFQMPVRLCYLQLSRMAGAEGQTDLLPLAVSDSLHESAQSRLQAIVPERGAGLLAVNINASDLSLARRWPVERFAEVMEYHIERGWRVVLVGSPDERDYVQKCADLVAPDKRHSVFNVAGLFPFAELPALLKLCDLLLTNDTGIMNFAFACQVRTVSLFGPNDPARYLPADGQPSLSIYKRTYCSPCVHYLDFPPCGSEQSVCMTSITVREVIENIAQALSAPLHARTGEDSCFCYDASGPLGVMCHRK
jgi:ADP-heptose:LPS heptosyltransferase